MLLGDSVVACKEITISIEESYTQIGNVQLSLDSTSLYVLKRL